MSDVLGLKSDIGHRTYEKKHRTKKARVSQGLWKLINLFLAVGGG